MRQKLFLTLVVCLACLFSARAQTVIESESNISFTGNSANVSLTVENREQSFDGAIEVALLDAENKIRGTAAQNAKIEAGKKSYNLTLPVGDLAQKKLDDLFWYRLRYRVGESSGVVSLSQIIRDVFDLRVIASNNLLSGMSYRSRIRALNPFTNQPVAGVEVGAELALELKTGDDQKLKLAATGETDRDGFATLDFQIPVEAAFSGEGEIKVTGRKNGVTRSVAESLRLPGDDYNFLMFADKPIYQPEQILSVRGILMKGSESKTVVADSEVEFRIEDEEGTVLYREKVKTSAFGVAAISWKIPENVKLGDYRIRVRNQQDDEDDNYIGYQKVKISRYDLPNFAVKAKALKSYYLPNEKQAEIEISADYLFGKPVTSGKVRVVREKERTWNWKEQKYDIEEGESREGAVDADGKFIAKFDLGEEHKELEDESDKFEDLNFTAYFTDPTTNKTEQRRFDVRLTREPIHVYWISRRDDQNPKLPVTGYVSTFYADGSPAICDVELKGREDDAEDEKYRTLQKIKTNSYGAGKLEFKRPKFEDEDADLEVQLIAKDKNGLKGTYGVGEDNEEEISFDADEESLKIAIAKTIFKPGETVEIQLTSTRQTAQVYVDVVQGWSVVDSHLVNLADGKARLKIPYQPNFKGELKISAYFEVPDTRSSYDYQTRSYYEEDYFALIKASRGIIFPSPSNLRLSADFDKEYYKPGEEGKISFGVVDSVGSAVESVLGAVIFDRAIEERARTDSDFSGVFSSYSGWLGYGDGFGGVNVKDLNELDLTKPVPDELQFVAEVILYDSQYEPNIFYSRISLTGAKSVYAEFFKKQFAPVEKFLRYHYSNQNFEHPTDDRSLRRILYENGIVFDDLRDPWEQSYKAVFETEKSQDVLRIVSAGADKIFDTRDDFTVSSQNFEYFIPTGQRISGALENYHRRTGGFITDAKTLLKELDLPELRDRFGRPYQITFETQGKYYLTKIRSAGKDGIASSGCCDDDFDVWLVRTDYFLTTEIAILKILGQSKKFPMDEAEFKSVLRAGGTDFDNLRDGYGEKLYLTKFRGSRYFDKAVIENVQKYGETTQTTRTVIKPVTQDTIRFTIRSKGKDKKEGNYDDATFAEFLHVISEQSKTDEKPQPVSIQPVLFTNGTGAISGTITDPSGAVVPNATITARNDAFARTIMSDENGGFLISNVPVGKYNVSATGSGFKTATRTDVPVTANNTTKVDFTLEAGTIDATVTVTSDASATVETSSSQISISGSRTTFSSLLKVAPNVSPEALAGGFQIDGASGAENVFVIDGKTFVKTPEGKLVPLSEKSTPRLREYFPETLVWSPELVTDKDGKATLSFKMADNITTWKLYTIASTRQGKIGVVEREVTVFQPFFVDLDPPKFLTDGDEIFLPTQVRNYTADKQKVDVTMAKSDWFTFLGADRQNIEVASNGATNAVFGFKANAVVKDGKQRVTAIAAKDSDAIEKPVTVRPNGQEIVRTESRLFSNSAAFDLDFPQNALPKTPRAEVKIYPNLMAHVTESVEGLLQRPYGCGEQTISSTYPNLMILKFKADAKTDGKSFLEQKAKKYLQKGYERLLGYQIADGGFSYWGSKDSSDVALTAYALRFLADARGFIEVDPKVIENAQNYLVKQQQADGSFTRKYYGETVVDKNRAKLFTAYVARTLAMLKTEKSVLDKALAFLKTRTAEIDEPYVLALYGLASLDAGNAQAAREVVQKLEKMAIAEGDRVYWKLETNTPFYGWGTAGRIETTALVLQLLIKTREQNPKSEELIGKATMFLLKSKDRYGVWYSTQTTINVLDAFLASLASSKGSSATVTVALNGEKLKDFAVSADQIEPFVLDLTGKLGSANRLEVTSSDGSPVMSQIVKTHYIDWKDAEVSSRNLNDSRAIRLDYKCDKTTAKIMETVTCAVEAERVGFQGYGMLLAEIGLPPGADVSRESLEKAFAEDWSLSRYDVLPDRIVVYMWAKAGGSKFNFTFKPRYGINAQTPASILYDYYNEEAKATIAPMRFEVK